jgi:hypothetical protein
MKMSDGSFDRRKVIRYRMSARVVFHWNGPRNARIRGEGTTRDVSLAGAYILTATSPPVNARVLMEIIFPALFTEFSTTITAEMKVLRVDQDIAGDMRSGFSVFGKGFSVSSGSRDLSGSNLRSAGNAL